jgi:hypothetical protein
MCPKHSVKVVGNLIVRRKYEHWFFLGVSAAEKSTGRSDFVGRAVVEKNLGQLSLPARSSK